eukprot:3429110-Amphidinium_carterae.1
MQQTSSLKHGDLHGYSLYIELVACTAKRSAPQWLTTFQWIRQAIEKSRNQVHTSTASQYVVHNFSVARGFTLGLNGKCQQIQDIYIACE